MKKIILAIVITCFFTAIIGFGAPVKLFADEISVNSGESIQSGINMALTNSSDTDYIYIDSGTYLEQLIINIPPGREIYLIGNNSDTTIISLPSGITGNVISADGGGKIHLEKVKITNGTRSGISINNSTYFYLTNSIISNNSNNIGGGINNYGGVLLITNSFIENNNSVLNGGGIYNDGTLNITDSKITNNSSSLSTGGGIYNAGSLNISNSNISNNTALNFTGIDTITELTNNFAENNWWGSDSGPYNLENNPLGTGDSVADNVDFYPFLLSDPFTSGAIEEDEENNDDSNNGDTQNPPGNEGNTSENPVNSGNNPSYGNSYFFNTDNLSLKYYFSLYDCPSKGFIKLLYNSILLREPDAEGFNHWENLLKNNHKSASGIAECLFFSEENIPRVSGKDNTEFLKYLYSGILFRRPDNEGFNNWLTIINNGSQRKYIFSLFASSDEWKNICTGFNINP